MSKKNKKIKAEMIHPSFPPMGEAMPSFQGSQSPMPIQGPQGPQGPVDTLGQGT